MEIAKVTKMAIQAAVAFQSTRGIIVLLFLLYSAAATACEYIIRKEKWEGKSTYGIQTISQRINFDKGGNQMAIVKEIRDGPCTIIIHDDAVVQTPEEKQRIIDNVSRIVIRALRAKEEPA